MAAGKNTVSMESPFWAFRRTPCRCAPGETFLLGFFKAPLLCTCMRNTRSTGSQMIRVNWREAIERCARSFGRKYAVWMDRSRADAPTRRAQRVIAPNINFLFCELLGPERTSGKVNGPYIKPSMSNVFVPVDQKRHCPEKMQKPSIP
jgi:hypothetical protein